MITGFADTFYFIARLNRSDQHHSRVVAYLQTLHARLVTTDCGSLVTMRDRRLTEAVTQDHHFEQAAFTALLKS